MTDGSERTLQVAIAVSFAVGFLSGWQAPTERGGSYWIGERNGYRINSQKHRRNWIWNESAVSSPKYMFIYQRELHHSGGPFILKKKKFVTTKTLPRAG